MSFTTKSSETAPAERPAALNGHLEYTAFGSPARSPFCIDDLADDFAQDLRVERNDDSFTSTPSPESLQRVASSQGLPSSSSLHNTNGRRVDFSLQPSEETAGRHIYLGPSGSGRAHSQPLASSGLGRTRSSGWAGGQRGSHRQREFALAKEGPMSKSFTAGSIPFAERSRGTGRRGPGSNRPARSSSGSLGPPLQPGGPAESRRGGQGFRRLWQAVTQVGRGEKLGGSEDSPPFAEMTVEDLLKVIRALPPDASAPKAIAQGLYYLDSGALAALLKVQAYLATSCIVAAH